MSWEDVDKSFDHDRPEDIIVHLDLHHFGEIVGRVCSELCRIRGIEPFDVNSAEAQHMAVDAWRYLCYMADRVEFKKSVAADLEALENDTQKSVTQESVPEHLPEFGGAAPLPDRAPKALESRLEPPV